MQFKDINKITKKEKANKQKLIIQKSKQIKKNKQELIKQKSK